MLEGFASASSWGATEIARQFYRRAIGFASSNIMQPGFGPTRSADSLIHQEDDSMPDRLGLTTIEEAGRKEDNSDHEGEAGMEDVM